MVTNKIIHFFVDAVFLDEYLWFFDWKINAFIKFSTLTLKCEYIWSVPNETDNIEGLYCGIAKCGDSIVLCPNRAKSIAIYDVVQAKMSQMEIVCERYSWQMAAMYVGWVTKDSVYFFRRGYSEIFRLNVQTKEIDVLNIIQREIGLEVDQYFWHYKTRQREKYVILYDKIHQTMFQYEKETYEVKILFHLDKERELVDFDSNGHFIWILCHDGMVYKFNEDKIVDRYYFDTDITDSLSLFYYNDTCFVINTKTGQYFSEYEIKYDVKKSNSFLAKETDIFSLVVDEDKIFCQEKEGKFHYSNGRNTISAIAKSDLIDIPLEAMYLKNDSVENTAFSIDYLLRQAEVYNYKKKQDKERECVIRGIHIHDYLK